MIIEDGDGRESCVEVRRRIYKGLGVACESYEKFLLLYASSFPDFFEDRCVLCTDLVGHRVIFVLTNYGYVSEHRIEHCAGT